ncbi:MAG: methyltransferase domain-containing protein, partial [Microcoleaceae cyanobacterium MO_207.B10]|nr:methyltransferase domain-containing protein [Microcoleaceae cyanobacterium MO_207.B10]
EVTSYLPEDHVVGFMRYEYGVDNKVYMPDIHASFHWWPDSVQKFGSYTLAEFSNKHAGSYLLTRSSLKIAINSGKYSIEPERSRNGILESAASDLFEYWGCGLKKLICISHLDQFLIHHMPDKYVGKLGILKDDLEVQIQALMGTTQDCVLFPGSLFQTETKLLWRRFDKSYYPLSNQQIIQMIGSGSKRILSVGCGYPETELELQNKGHEVIAIPLDAIIAVNANAKAIKTVVPNFEEAINSLSSQRFDYIIFDEILPHLQEVETVLVQFAKLLKNHGSIIATMLNGKSTRIQYPLKGKYHPKSGPSLNPFLPLEPASDNFNNFKALGLHLTNEKIARNWFQNSGLKVKRVTYYIPPIFRKSYWLSLGLQKRQIAPSFMVVATN